MSNTPRIGAPLLTLGQAAPETTVNAQATLFDAFTCPHFKDRDLTAPPGSPAQGDCYLVAASPTGAWTSQAGNVAIYINTSWTFVVPKEGFLFWVDDENALILYDGATWSAVGLSTGTFLQSANNLSDVASAATSRTNLGVYSASQVDAAIATAVTGLLDLKGATDCSANPNYPAASKGDYYYVTVAGKIGGASGTSVAIGDVYFALADNAGGTQGAVGSSWDVLVHASVAAGGGLLAANNLSDVASKVAAKDNISVKGADIASASTTDLSTATGDFVFVTGTTTITALGTCAAGVERTVKFAGALTLTHNATSLILPSAANITTAANDVAVFRSLGSGNWLCVGYTKANGQALTGSSSVNIVDANWFNVKDYGALGDGVHLTDGVTNSTTTFTSASAAFVSGDVGKVIEITSGTNRLLTTIAARASSTSITLTAAASFTATGCDVYYGTDDTAAIQNASNACETAGGGTVYFPRSIYIANGALQDTSRSNAQILLPRRNYGATKAITVVLRGEAPPPQVYSVVGATPIADNLSIIKGTLNTASGTAPCLIGAHGPVGTLANFTNLYLVMRDLAVRMPANPALTACDFSCVAQIDVDNVLIDAGNWDVSTIAVQTTAASYGLRTPGSLDGALTRLGVVTVVGFYNGYEIGEHCFGQLVNAGGCKKALSFVAVDHASAFARLCVQHCQNGLVFAGTHVTTIQQYDIEHASSGTWVPTYDIDDASGYRKGEILWHVVLANTGIDYNFTVNGSNLSGIRRLYQPTKGTSFPSNPSDDDRFYRTDQNLEYLWDAANSIWVSTTEFNMHIAMQTSLLPISATGGASEAFAVNPGAGQYDIYVIRAAVTNYNTLGTPASNYFSYQFKTYDAGTGSNLGSALSGQNDAQNTFVTHTVNINATVAQSVEALSIIPTKTGTQTAYFAGSLSYRRIGV